MKKGTLTERGDKTDEAVYSAPPLGDPGGGGGHSDPDGAARRRVGRVPAAGDRRVQPDRGRRGLCVRHPDRSVRGGCVIGGFLQDAGQLRCAALWGTGLLCGGFQAALLPGEKGAWFWAVFSIPAGLGTVISIRSPGVKA